MISRDALVTKISGFLDQEYVALLGQRGDKIDGVITGLRSAGTQRDLRFISLSLPQDVADPKEFQSLVLDGLVHGAKLLPGGATFEREVRALLRKHRTKTLGYRIHEVLKLLGLGTATGRLVIVVYALPEVAKNRLKELLM